MFDFIASLFSAIANFFDFSKQKQALKNTPEIQSNADAKIVQADKTKAINDVNNPDITKLREDVAE